MTRDKLLALRRTCPECGGTGTCDVDLYLEDGGAHICVADDCETCAGTGYVLPATDEVLCETEMAQKRIAELEAALVVERRAVEVLAEYAECTIESCPGTCACVEGEPCRKTVAEWARKQAREEGGE